MAEPVISRLEMIEIDGMNRDAPIAAFGHNPHQVGGQHRTIEQPGHRIGPRKLLILLLENHLIEDRFARQPHHFEAADHVARSRVLDALVRVEEVVAVLRAETDLRLLVVLGGLLFFAADCLEACQRGQEHLPGGRAALVLALIHI